MKEKKDQNAKYKTLYNANGLDKQYFSRNF